MANTAKVLMRGRPQAVRLPRVYRADAAEMTLKRIGDALVLRPVRQNTPERFLSRRDARLAAQPGDSHLSQRV